MYHNPAVVVSFHRRLQNNPLFCFQVCRWLKKLDAHAGARCFNSHDRVSSVPVAPCGKNTNDIHILCFSTVRAVTKNALFHLPPMKCFRRNLFGLGVDLLALKLNGKETEEISRSPLLKKILFLSWGRRVVRDDLCGDAAYDF